MFFCALTIKNGLLNCIINSLYLSLQKDIFKSNQSIIIKQK